MLVKQGISNDKVKYSLPECYKTELSWTINARSLQNFLKLRTSKSALWEIRELATNIFNALPKEHQYIYEDFVTPLNK
jgi:thymidylate synthase (FAD)